MRTNNYIMTCHVGSARDMAELGRLRDTIKKLNKINGTKMYVKCHGRGSRIEAAWNSGNPMNVNSYRAELPLRFAERMDVYVYTR